MRKLFFALVFSLAAIGLVAGPALAQKRGGILRAQHRGNPPSMSILEEATVSTNWPAMPVMSNLVLYDVFKEVESLKTIKGELASKWRWSKDGKSLTFTLKKGVKFHDGKPLTAKDVVHTWDLLKDKAPSGKLRKNPRKIWYKFLVSVKAKGDYQVTFNLKRRQPSLMAMLASGYAAVYPAHVSPAKMRTAPIGSGPFVFKSWERGQQVKLTRNPNYFRKGRPYLDGITYFIIKSRETRVLALAAGEHDISLPYDVTTALEKDLKARKKDIVTVLKPSNVSVNLIINPEKAPMDDPELRRALTLAIDRQAFIDTLSQGNGIISSSLMPPPYGVWGLPQKELRKLYGSVKKNRARAKAVMKKKGYSASKPLKMKISTRNISIYRDPAALLIDHLKQIGVEAELELVETSNWHAKVARRDYQVGLNLTGLAPDDPDAMFYENFDCTSQRNYAKYCNPELEKLFDKQSQERNFRKRLKLVHRIERELIKDVARPLFYHRRNYTAWQPHVKNIFVHQSTYNAWRMDEVWLDK